MNNATTTPTENTPDIHEDVILGDMSNQELAQSALTGYMLGMDDFPPVTALLEVIWSNPEVFSEPGDGNLEEFLETLCRVGVTPDGFAADDPGAPKVAQTAADVLRAAGFELATDTNVPHPDGVPGEDGLDLGFGDGQR